VHRASARGLAPVAPAAHGAPRGARPGQLRAHGLAGRRARARDRAPGDPAGGRAGAHHRVPGHQRLHGRRARDSGQGAAPALPQWAETVCRAACWCGCVCCSVAAPKLRRNVAVPIGRQAPAGSARAPSCPGTHSGSQQQPPASATLSITRHLGDRACDTAWRRARRPWRWSACAARTGSSARATCTRSRGRATCRSWSSARPRRR